ncbi:peptide chain release factor 1 [Deinococcus aquiradiocola]|uniref:Peptide chain release factor 1 n=1 Tax=Deinococcus aquiradiocola TaxID=393059 RepID=A0A917UJ64_9DEIO|nr:peptide chain release factor 1 [Deinococcus aquiradiocola]GGJ61744.1 peptide chain release factor 1 [Deinococcus aquiradiocola]
MLSGRIEELGTEYAAIERSLGDPAVLADTREYTRLTRRHRELTPLITLWTEYRAQERLAQDARSLLTDPEMADLARSELDAALTRMATLENELEVLLLPRDPYDSHDVILELRAGAGGDEAGLFAADLLRLYTRYVEGLNLKLSVADASESDLGGYSRLVAEVAGENAYRAMKWERGVHRVQRVPATETQGRIHTSTVTVAVLPQVEQEDVQLDLSEVRIDVFRAQGAGGQGVNTTDSAVRATYRAGTPEEIMVVCQDGRSQIKNKEKALQILRARLAERQREERAVTEREARSAQVGSGDRSEKIRTYNYPQNRVTDHRLTGDDKNFALDSVMEGALAGVVTALERAEREQQLSEMTDHATA